MLMKINKEVTTAERIERLEKCTRVLSIILPDIMLCVISPEHAPNDTTKQGIIESLKGLRSLSTEMSLDLFLEILANAPLPNK